MTSGKAFIFSAPSGSGKTTIVQHLLSNHQNLGFSISATTRQKRNGEVDGKDYYFLKREEFEKKIEKGEFIEWEQVYEGIYYGTLKEEVQRIWDEGRHVLFDVDVVGALNLKNYFGDKGIAIFVKAPNLATIEQRLKSRNTETEESFKKRIAKVKYELSFEPKFDISLLNDNLNQAFLNAENIISQHTKV